MTKRGEEEILGKDLESVAGEALGSPTVESHVKDQLIEHDSRLPYSSSSTTTTTDSDSKV